MSETNLPENHILAPGINLEDLVIVSVPLPYLTDRIAVRKSSQFRTALNSLKDKMAQKEWVEKSMPGKDTRILAPVHVSIIVDYCRQDNKPYLYLVASNRFGESCFLPKGNVQIG